MYLKYFFKCILPDSGGLCTGCGSDQTSYVNPNFPPYLFYQKQQCYDIDEDARCSISAIHLLIYIQYYSKRPMNARVSIFNVRGNFQHNDLKKEYDLFVWNEMNVRTQLKTYLISLFAYVFIYADLFLWPVCYKILAIRSRRPSYNFIYYAFIAVLCRIAMTTIYLYIRKVCARMANAAKFNWYMLWWIFYSNTLAFHLRVSSYINKCHLSEKVGSCWIKSLSIIFVRIFHQLCEFAM